MAPTLRVVAGALGNIFAAALIAAPVCTMIDIRRDNSVGQRWVLNYVGTFANAVCMVAYALPIKNYFVTIINGVAIVVEFGYTCFYRRYAQGHARTIATWSIVGELVWGAAVLTVYFTAFSGGRHEELRVKLFGTAAGVTSGIMYIAMLPDAWSVFRTHDVRNQNILLLLSALGNSISWTVFAVKPRDLAIEVPNSGGAGLTAIQTISWVATWIRYRNVAPQQPQQLNQGGVQQERNIELPAVIEARNA